MTNIHPIDMIRTENKNQIRIMPLYQIQILKDCVGSALEPLRSHSHLRRDDCYEMIPNPGIESNSVSHVQWAIGTCIGQGGKWSISANWQDYSGRSQQSGIDPQKEPRAWTETLSRERVSPLFHLLKPRPVSSDISLKPPCNTFWVWIVRIRMQADWPLLRMNPKMSRTSACRSELSSQWP